MNVEAPAFSKENMQESASWYTLFDKISPKDKWFIDIGSSFGMVSFCSVNYKPSKIICFEPSFYRYTLLHKNIIENNLTHLFHIFNKACGDKNEKLKFISSPTNDNGGLLTTEYLDRKGSFGIEETVHCVNIYDFLINVYSEEDVVSNLGMIKIDTEGHDFVILNALKPIIDKCKPIIIVEWWYEESLNIKLFDAIRNLNYQAFNSETLEPISEKDFSKKSHNLVLKPI